MTIDVYLCGHPPKRSFYLSVLSHLLQKKRRKQSNVSYNFMSLFERLFLDADLRTRGRFEIFFCLFFIRTGGSAAVI